MSKNNWPQTGRPDQGNITNSRSSSTYRAFATANKKYEDNSYCFTPARAKVRGAVEVCNWMGIDYLKEQKFINKKVVSIPEKLQAIKDEEEKVTGY